MKIMICGKGGCGKSTIASLMTMEYVRAGKKVLVVDTDESNFGLHRQLGVELPKDFTRYFGGKKGVMGTLRSETGEPFFEKKWSFEDLPSEYTVQRDGIIMMAIGKIHEAGEGCACAMGVLAKNFLANLEEGPDDVVITDMEAGVEHFGRGVDTTADAILMIVDPSYESLKLSEKILEMGESIGKPVYYILNKIDSEKEKMMRDVMKNPDRIIAAIPSSTEVLTKGLKGERLDCEVHEIRGIIEYLADKKI